MLSDIKINIVPIQMTLILCQSADVADLAFRLPGDERLALI